MVICVCVFTCVCVLFCCLDVKPEPQEEPIEVDKLAGFVFLASLNYDKDLIVKAYAANDSMYHYSVG